MRGYNIKRKKYVVFSKKTVKNNEKIFSKLLIILISCIIIIGTWGKVVEKITKKVRNGG